MKSRESQFDPQSRRAPHRYHRPTSHSSLQQRSFPSFSCSSPPILAAAQRSQPHPLTKLPKAARQLFDRGFGWSLAHPQLFVPFPFEPENFPSGFRNTLGKLLILLRRSGQSLVDLQNVILTMADEADIAASTHKLYGGFAHGCSGQNPTHLEVVRDDQTAICDALAQDIR